MNMPQLPRYLFSLALLLGCAGLAAAEQVTLYTHYGSAPFAVDEQPASSYSVRLAAWLTAQSAGRYQFVARQLPKLRLERLLARDDWSGVVAWGNPAWFGDPQRQRFLWSRGLMRDSDLLVSRQTERVSQAALDAGPPRRFGGIIGHRYAALERYLQSGQLLREDAQTEVSNARKLRHGRVDVLLVQASSLPYLRAQFEDFEQWAYVDKPPLVQFERYLFTSRGNGRLMAFLDQALLKLEQAPEWRELMQPEGASR